MNFCDKCVSLLRYRVEKGHNKFYSIDPRPLVKLSIEWTRGQKIKPAVIGSMQMINQGSFAEGEGSVRLTSLY